MTRTPGRLTQTAAWVDWIAIICAQASTAKEAIVNRCAGHSAKPFGNYLGRLKTSAWTMLIYAAVVCLLMLGSTSSGLATPPNIVVILGDDVGWGDIQAYNPQSSIPTPNLNRLAQEGMRFTNAHSSAASCAPTRYSAITGNYQWRGLRPYGTWNFQDQSQILPGQLTLGDITRIAGYSTAFIGKMHLGGDFFERGSSNITRDGSRADFSRPFDNGPIAHGFDYSFTLLEGIQSAPYAYFENDQLVGDHNLLRQWLPGGYGRSGVLAAGIGMPYWDSSRVGEDLMFKALGFIDQHIAQYGSSKPFFLYYAATAAHSPFTPADTFFGQQVRGVTGLCSRQDMIYELDLAVGVLTERLRANGSLGNTIFVFTSDNGGNDACGHDSSGPTFSGHKFQVQEGGHRVPLLVRWGDGSSFAIPPGTVREQLVGVHDLVATIATVVGQPLAADQARDSFNMLPVFLGTASDGVPVRDHLIAQAIQGPSGEKIPPTFAYYEGEWKLIVRLNGRVFSPLALYNLQFDPAETGDITATNLPRVSAMLDRFVQRYGSSRSAPLVDATNSAAAFDGLQYIASNPDLLSIFGVNPLLGAQHYSQFGQQELRVTDSFNEVSYLLKYSDLVAAFGFDFEAATSHFITYGYFENRTAN